MGFFDQLLKLLGLKKESGEGSASAGEKGDVDTGASQDTGSENQENTGM